MGLLVLPGSRALAPVHNTFDLIKVPRVCFEPLVAFDADEIGSLTLEICEPVSLQECFLKRVDRLAVFLEERLDLCLPASNVNVSFRREEFTCRTWPIES